MRLEIFHLQSTATVFVDERGLESVWLPHLKEEVAEM